jgi:hypothetical protein
MLGAPAIPVLQGTWGESRGVGRSDFGLPFCGAPGSPVGQCLAEGGNLAHLTGASAGR